MKHLSVRDFLWSLPLSLVLGAGLASLQPGTWLIGWLSCSLLFFLSFSVLTYAARWADGGQALAWMVALAFFLRLGIGVATYVLLPVNGYDDADDRAGYVFTDAHRRDKQAWELAVSDKPIFNAFSKKFAYDQYGGLLAFSATLYRYLSPDAHRPLMLVLLSALVAALGLPFLWKAACLQWGVKVAQASGWIFALYPESMLLGSAAMREPYLMLFSALALWGFAGWGGSDAPGGWRHLSLWLGLALAGMLLVSPAVALVTLVILAGWWFFTSERGRLPWWGVVVAVLVFAAGLLLLSASLNRQRNLNADTPVGILGAFVREAVKWDVYQLERGSGWVQKLFDEMPAGLRLPFVMIYGIFQPVLPATFFEPTTLTWQVIGILRAAGWYALLPVLVFAFLTGTGQSSGGRRPDVRWWLWLAGVVWAWVLFTALRGGGDQWDNPRYRAILFVWQALLAGWVLARQRETGNIWFMVVIACEVIFLAVFTQWYGSRYFHLGGQLPFAGMVALILALWAAIVGLGWWRARLTHSAESL